MIRTLRFGTELRRFFRTRMTSAAVIVAVCIPLLYGALYLWAFWNPYDKVDQLSVALVNEDRSVVAGDGTTVDAGTQVTDALLSSKALRWHQTTSSEAAVGVASGRYYASVTIPEGFSTAATSAASAAPVAATIQVTYDDANGYTTRSLLASVMRELRSTVSASLGDAMVEKVLLGVNDISSGLTAAGDGATKLADGTTSLAAGAQSAADGAASLASGASTLATGTDSAASGAVQLSSGAKTLADGAASAASGAAALGTGASSVASGASELSTGMSGLSAGAAHLASGASSAASGATSVATGLDAISAAASAVQTSTSQLSTGASQLAAGNRALAQAATSASQDSAPTITALQQLVAALPDTDPQKAELQAQLAALGGRLSALAAQTQAVSAGADKVQTGAVQLAQQSPGLLTAIGTADVGSHQVETGSAQVSAGAATLASGAQQAATSSTQLAAGAAQVAAGADTLSSGAGSVSSGAQTLSAKSAELSSGLTTLDTGAQDLASGSTRLASGTKELAQGAVQTRDGAASLRDGISSALDKLPTFADAAGSATVMSNPVTLSSAWSHEASSMGEGYAPYFVGLALYVGALILWMLLRPISKRALAAPVSALRLVLSGGLPAIALGLAQVAVLFLVLIPGLGLHPGHPLATLVFAALVSIAFVSLQQMIAIWLGPAVGRLTVLVLLMLQLTSAGGMFPASTSPVLFQVLHEVLPLSRVVNGFREAITGDLSTVFATSVTYMVVLIGLNVAMATWGAARQRTWTITRLHPDVSL